MYEQYDPSTITPTIASEVLSIYGHGLAPANTFTRHLVYAIESASPAQRAQLRKTHAPYVCAVHHIRNTEDGVQLLTDIAATAVPETPEQQVALIRRALVHARPITAAIAADAPGPWISMDGSDRLVHDPGHDLDAPVYVVREAPDSAEAAEHFALMDPHVADRLYALLEGIADSAGAGGAPWLAEATAIARALLHDGTHQSLTTDTRE